jgi:D-alanyl-D-alanine carboxypeptidase
MRLLIVLALCGSVLPAPAQAQAAQPAAEVSTVVSPGQQSAVDELLAAINAGGGAALDAWIERHALLRPTKGPDSWRDWFGRIARTSGGLALDHIDAPTAGGELRVWVRTGRGGALRRFSLFADPAGSERINDFLIAVWPTPYTDPLIRAQATQEQLAELVRARVAFGAERDEFSGAALLAVRGRAVASASAGMADPAAGRSNTVDTRFHVGSMGKMFTAVAIARQVQEGRLRFDTRLIEVLPEYPDSEAARAITIAHLLSHTSGISLPYVEPTAPQDIDPERIDDALPRIAAQPLAFSPGSRSSYSNEGYTVLGAVLEAVTGQTYYDVIQRTVFDAAGMKDTAFDRPGDPAPDTAVGYRYGADDALGVLPREPNTPFLLDRGGPSGGAYSTVRDLTAFLNAFRNGRLVSAEMTDALLTAEPNGQNRYGKGFMIIPAGGRRMVGHSGGGPNSGINADAMIVWETGWSYAVAGNYDAPAAQAVAGALLAAAVTQPETI